MTSFIGLTKFDFIALKQSDIEETTSCYWACFPLSIQFALNCCGYDISFQDVISEAKRHRSIALLASRGMTIHDAVAVLKSFGSMPEIKQFSKNTLSVINEIRALLKQNKALIAIQADHALVITGIDSKLIYFYDPDDCKSLISKQMHRRFFDSWLSKVGFLALVI